MMKAAGRGAERRIAARERSTSLGGIEPGMRMRRELATLCRAAFLRHQEA